MNERIITLDINKNILKKEKYKKYSTDNLLIVIIKENDKDVDLNGYTANVYFELPSGEVLTSPCNILNNQVNINLTNDLFLNKGKVYFEITLKNSIQKVTTFMTCLEII